MTGLNRHELSLCRLEVAVDICIRYPAIYRRITEHTPIYRNFRELLAAQLLRGLMNIEPAVRHTIEYYYKREMR